VASVSYVTELPMILNRQAEHFQTAKSISLRGTQKVKWRKCLCWDGSLLIAISMANDPLGIFRRRPYDWEGSSHWFPWMKNEWLFKALRWMCASGWVGNYFCKGSGLKGSVIELFADGTASAIFNLKSKMP